MLLGAVVLLGPDRRLIGRELLVTTQFVGDLVPAVCDRLHGRGGVEFAGQEPCQRGVENDLRIPNNQKYQQVVLDQTLARFLAGEIDAPTTMKTITDGWNEITDELGRDKQLAAYKSTIGAK